MTDWMEYNKELAIQFGSVAYGYVTEQVIELGKDKKFDVLEDKHDPSHNTNVADGSTIGPRKEKLIEKYHQDKAARQAKK